MMIHIVEYFSCKAHKLKHKIHRAAIIMYHYSPTAINIFYDLHHPCNYPMHLINIMREMHRTAIIKSPQLLEPLE